MSVLSLKTFRALVDPSKILFTKGASINGQFRFQKLRTFLENFQNVQ